MEGGGGGRLREGRCWGMGWQETRNRLQSTRPPAKAFPCSGIMRMGVVGAVWVCVWGVVGVCMNAPQSATSARSMWKMCLSCSSSTPICFDVHKKVHRLQASGRISLSPPRRTPR